MITDERYTNETHLTSETNDRYRNNGTFFLSIYDFNSLVCSNPVGKINLENLRYQIITVFDSIKNDCCVIEREWQSMTRRFSACVQARGRNLEHFL